MDDIKPISDDDHKLSYFFLQLDTHSKFTISEKKYQALSRALRVHIAKYDTIPSSKAPK